MEKKINDEGGVVKTISGGDLERKRVKTMICLGNKRIFPFIFPAERKFLTVFAFITTLPVVYLNILFC